MEIKKINVKIVSSKGHDEKELDIHSARDFIVSTAREKSKWIYVDGQHVSPEDITIDMLAVAQDITLTNALTGGRI